MNGTDPRIVLVTGGARSGKSTFARNLFTDENDVAFIATMTACDSETADRIEKHRQTRPADWTTYETGGELPQAVSRAIKNNHRAVIIDCVAAHVGARIAADIEGPAIVDEIIETLDICSAGKAPVVIVTNEVGADLAPGTTLGSRFPLIMGAANSVLAERSDRTIFMIAGIPRQIKPQVYLGR